MIQLLREPDSTSISLDMVSNQVNQTLLIKDKIWIDHKTQEAKLQMLCQLEDNQKWIKESANINNSLSPSYKVRFQKWKTVKEILVKLRINTDIS